MTTILGLAVVLSTQIIISLTQNCPSTQWTYCVEEGERCTIHPYGSNHYGYLSYGANGRWTLIPFTITAVNVWTHYSWRALTIECDNTHGDVISGIEKHCCFLYRNSGNEFSRLSYPLTEISEGTNWVVSGSNSVRFGYKSSYVHRVLSSANAACTTAFMSDPKYDKVKHCHVVKQIPSTVPSLGSGGWTLCGDEGGDCTAVATSGAQWIRFGAGSSYYMRLVISTDARFPCNKGIFGGDPASGTEKSCYRSSSFSIGSMVSGGGYDKYEALEDLSKLNRTLMVIGLLLIFFIVSFSAKILKNKNNNKIKVNFDAISQSDTEI